MASTRTRQDRRRSRHQRVRKRISGTGGRPRMAIMVSNKHMYVQFIDDQANSTLAQRKRRPLRLTDPKPMFRSLSSLKSAVVPAVRAGNHLRVLARARRQET